MTIARSTGPATTTPSQPFPFSAGLPATLYPPNSRYHGLNTRTRRLGDRTVAYLERRFLPQPDEFVELRVHTVTSGDRLDKLAYQYIGDPELYWRLCDANRAMDPEELTSKPGQKIRITLPKGMPGVTHE